MRHYFMETTADILSLATLLPVLGNFPTPVLVENSRISDQISYAVSRVQISSSLPVEEIAEVHYQPKTAHQSPQVHLRYCLLRERFCQHPACTDQFCQENKKEDCPSEGTVLDIIQISFDKGFLEQNLNEIPGSGVLEGFGKDAFEKSLPLTGRMKNTLDQLMHAPYQGTLKNIFIQSKALELLLYSSDEFIRKDPEEKYGCRFLTHPEDQAKIRMARDILLKHLEQPITIRELSRKVAINECYLKKGFKAMYGTTIYDYFQKERMVKARFLLCEQGLSVSEVAVSMGYTCISHFSSAFKKHTGLKPCELLGR
ncbi:MAG: helix-turn-helix domain-containing protein [Chitinophagaceae bacterium]